MTSQTNSLAIAAVMVGMLATTNTTVLPLNTLYSLNDFHGFHADLSAPSASLQLGAPNDVYSPPIDSAYELSMLSEEQMVSIIKSAHAKIGSGIQNLDPKIQELVSKNLKSIVWT